VLEPKTIQKSYGPETDPEWKGPDVGGSGAFGGDRERAWISLSRERSVKRLPDQNWTTGLQPQGGRRVVLPGQRVARGYIASAISGILAGDTKLS